MTTLHCLWSYSDYGTLGWHISHFEKITENFLLSCQIRMPVYRDGANWFATRSDIQKKYPLPPPPPRSSLTNSVGWFRDREAACLASDCQGSNIKSCIWTHNSRNLRSAYSADLTRYDGIWRAPDSLQRYQEVILAQFSLYNFIHKNGLRLHSFVFRSHCTPVSCGGYRDRKDKERVFYSWSLTLPTHLVFSKSRTNSGSISNETPQPISFIALFFLSHSYTRHRPYGGLMLCHRLRRWHSMKPA